MSNHTCHYPGCKVEVPPRMWGCKRHWYSLPIRLRNLIWKTYVPGQEITKTPSIYYLTAAREVQRWIQEQQNIQKPVGGRPKRFLDGIVSR